MLSFGPRLHPLRVSCGREKYSFPRCSGWSLIFPLQCGGQVLGSLIRCYRRWTVLVRERPVSVTVHGMVCRPPVTSARSTCLGASQICHGVSEKPN